MGLNQSYREWEGYGRTNEDALNALDARLRYWGVGNVHKEQVGGTGKEPQYSYTCQGLPVHLDQHNGVIRAFLQDDWRQTGYMPFKGAYRDY